MNRKFYALILSVRNRHLLFLDVLVMLVTPAMALVIRNESLHTLSAYIRPLVIYTAGALTLKLLVFYFTGMYTRYWRMASVHEITVLSVATGVVWLFSILLYHIVLRPLGMVIDLPRSVPVIDGALTMLAVGGMRFGLRLVFDLDSHAQASTNVKACIVAGAGVAGSMIVKEMRTNPQLALEPVGFVDDDPRKIGVRIHGIQVLGTLSDLPEVLGALEVAEVLIAMPTAPGKVIRQVVEACKAAKVKSRTIPGVYEILDGTTTVSQIRNVDIEDLLRRGVVKIDNAGVSAILRGTRVLVTGAGGSIGGELCRQIAVCGPKELVLLGHGENSVFQIAGELRRNFPGVNVSTVVADIRDRVRINAVFACHSPQIVFHAAAHKHVGLMELNVPDAVSNNVMGTRLLVDLAAYHDVERFVMISSDKAVNPTSIMGATKRVAERIVHEAAVRTGRKFVSVRFGNVLGSRGSVVPIFRQQIATGGPVMVTHPDVTRYFMTIPEAVQLVLQAAALGEGGGETFVLDMGEPIRILDLARDVVRLSGLEEGVDIDIKFTGLKQGEKMHEALFYDWEKPQRSSNEKIFVCRAGSQGLKSLLDGAGVRSSIGHEEDLQSGAGLRADVDQLIKVAQSIGEEGIHQMLKKIIPEYNLPQESKPVALAPPSH